MLDRDQKIAMTLGLVVIVLMLLYPPWYHFVMAPNPAPAPPGMIRIPLRTTRVTRYVFIFNARGPWQTRLNKRRLLVQCAAVVVITGLTVLKHRWC